MSIKTHKELQKLRKQRKKEFELFLKEPALISVLNKLVSFLTDENSQHLTLRVTSGSDSYTDGKTITLGMLDDFFDEQYGEDDWVAVFKTLLVHEVQHINSSNFKDMEAIGNFYAPMMQQYSFPEEFAKQVARDFLNIMEDSRIEHIYSQKLPGFKLPTLLVNNSIRQHGAPEKVAKKPFEEFNDFRSNALSYALTGRLAPNMSIYAGSRLESEFIAVADLFDAAVEARTSDECRQICEKMLTMTAPYFGELLKEEAEQAKVQQQILQQIMEYTSNMGTEENPGSASGDEDEGGSGGLRVKRKTSKGEKSKDDKDGASGSGNEKQQSKSGKEDDSSDGEQEQGGSQAQSGNESSNSSGSNNGNGEASGSSDDNSSSKDDADGSQSDGKKLAADKEQLLDRTKNWTGSFSDLEDDHAQELISQEELAQIRRGIRDEIDAANIQPVKVSDRAEADIKAIYGDHYDFSERFPKISVHEAPADLVTQAKRLERAIEQVLHQKRVERRNTRSGRLDSRSLYRYGMSDPHLFMRKGQPMEADMAVYLLMDNSGSMSSCGAQMDGKRYSKSNLSRTAAAVIEMAMSNVAALKVTLFDSCGTIRHETLKKFDDRGKNKRESRCYSSINQVGTGGGNKDGFSIRMATKDLVARRESKKVLLVLSDGLPSDYRGGEMSGMDDVRDAVREARRKGIIVIPIMYGDAAFRKQSQEDFAHMYERFISCDPIEVVDQFQKLFLQLVKKA